MARRLAAFAALLLILAAGLLAFFLRPHSGPPDAVIFIIRHAEKPETGFGLTPQGHQRADAYANYFRHFPSSAKPLALDAIFAAADSGESHRPRLTVTPLAQATGLPIDTRFDNKNTADLADLLRATYQGKHVLVCWHQGEIPDLLRALGAKPDQFLPKGNWPSQTYDWVIQLTFDHDGHLNQAESRRIDEALLPTDAR